MSIKPWIAATTLSAALALSTSTWAQCQAGKQQQAAGNNSPKSCCAGCVAQKGDAAGQKAECAAQGPVCGGAQCVVPAMVYKVGDDVLSCPSTAEELARKNGGVVRYVVGGVEYTDRAKALDAYAAALENYVKGVATVQFSVGGRCFANLEDARQRAQQDGSKIRYCVGSYMFDDHEVAKRAAKVAQEAASKVEMNPAVAGQQCCCGTGCAAPCQGTCQKCGCPVGECRTRCRMTARCELAKARIDAARQVLAKEAGA